MKSRTLSKKDIRELNEKLLELFGVELFKKKDNLRIVDEIAIVKDDLPVLFVMEGEYVPALKSILKNNFLKKVTVDMGAVKFLVNGAHVMAPGVVGCEDVSEGEIVCVVDQNNERPFVVGKALCSKEKLFDKDSGKVLKNLHYVGDDLWNKF